MKESVASLCPCSSGKSYTECCESFHLGRLPETALQLMRSRYSAYAYGCVDYLIETTHPANPQRSDNLFVWKRSLSQFSRNTRFEKLEVIDFQERRGVAIVLFTAHLTQNGRDASFTERSYFEKVKERWLYRGGKLLSGHLPNPITLAQLKILPLAYYGDPILRQKAEPVGEVDEFLRQLVEEMVETMDACEGIGLAAPQIHHSIRLFVIRAPIKKAKGKLEAGEVEVFINPILSDPSPERWSTSEGCLSIPTLHAQVERPEKITVEYMTLDGQRRTERMDGWRARVIFHENDHLDGVLFIDHLPETLRAKYQPALKAIQEKMHEGTEL